MGTINLNAPVSPLVGTAPSPSRVNAPPSIRGLAGMKLFGGSLSNSLAGDLEGLSQSINALHKIMQTTQTVSTGTLTDLTSTGGVTPDLLTLTIAGGLLTISGTGTEAGHGDITIDGTMRGAGLTVSGDSALAVLAVSGGTTLDGDIGGTHGQNVGTGDSPGFAGLTVGALATFNGPVKLNGNVSGTHGQNIGSGDSPTFANLTTTLDLTVGRHPIGTHLQDLGAGDGPTFDHLTVTNDLTVSGHPIGTHLQDLGAADSPVFAKVTAGELSLAAKAAAPTAPGAGFAFLYYDNTIGALRYNLAGAGWIDISAAGVGGANTQVLFNDGGVEAGDASLTWAKGPKILSALFVSTAGLTVTSNGIDVTGPVVFHSTPEFRGTNSTGAGAALLGANCPAVTPAAPNTWIQVVTAAGATAYIPAWV